MKSLRDFGVYFVGSAVVASVNILLVPVYSRYLVPADYAVLTLQIYVITIVTTLADLGQNTAFCVLYYKQSARSNLLYNSLFVSFVAFAVFCAPVLTIPGLVSWLIRVPVPYAVQAKIVLIAALTLFANFFASLLRLTQKPLLFTLTSLARAAVMGLLNVLFLVVFRQTYDAYLNAMLFALLIPSVWGVVYILRAYPTLGVSLDVGLLRRLLRIGLPLLPFSLLAFGFQASDKYLMNALMTTGAMGLYAFGFKFGTIMETFLTNSLGQAFSPAIYKAYATGREAYAGILRNLLLLFLVLGFATLLGFATFGDLFYRVVVGTAYWDSFPVAVLSLFGYLLSGAAAILNATIVAREKTYFSPAIIACTIVVSVGCALVLIPRIGSMGAVLSFVLACATTLVITYSISQRLFHVDHHWRTILSVSAILGGAVVCNHLLSDVRGLTAARVLVKTLIALVALLVTYLVAREPLRAAAGVGLARPRSSVEGQG